MADAEFARLHRASVAWHQARVHELKGKADYCALYDATTRKNLPDAIWRWRDTPVSRA